MGDSKTVQAADTAFEIIETLKRENRLTLTELANEIGYAKSTVHKYLRTLERRGYVVRDDNEYRVAVRFLDLGIYARNECDLYHHAKPQVDELAETTDEKAWLITEEHGVGVHLYGAEGNHTIVTYARAGQITYLHQTAAGKAILAYLEDDRIETILDRYGLPAETDRTITDRDELFERIERIRDRGYAFNREETVEGLHAVGAPICDGSGDAIGAISVSGPANRLKGDALEEEIPSLLLGSVNEAEINLTYA